ncbi:PREDICTED: uncharacterized protein LOC108445723, partial [Corvus brachyrhynchos]|uniref:uncharacterized protein LOC108445723 n=1 Tax=Corvus brachyrhynchos TaxID=85066 RepID=UPI0008166587
MRRRPRQKFPGFRQRLRAGRAERADGESGRADETTQRHHRLRFLIPEKFPRNSRNSNIPKTLNSTPPLGKQGKKKKSRSGNSKDFFPFRLGFGNFRGVDPEISEGFFPGFFDGGGWGGKNRDEVEIPEKKGGFHRIPGFSNFGTILGFFGVFLPSHSHFFGTIPGFFTFTFQIFGDFSPPHSRFLSVALHGILREKRRLRRRRFRDRGAKT